MSTVAFHHVVAESLISQDILQIVEIGLDVGLHRGVGVVEIAESVEIVARVFCSRAFSFDRTVAGCVGLIVLTYFRISVIRVIPMNLILLSVYDGVLLGKVGPTVEPVFVVDDDILNDTGAFLLKGVDHRVQLLLCTKARIVLQPETRIVAHRCRCTVEIIT